jgi:hypothetical protein
VAGVRVRAVAATALAQVTGKDLVERVALRGGSDNVALCPQEAALILIGLATLIVYGIQTVTRRVVDRIYVPGGTRQIVDGSCVDELSRSHEHCQNKCVLHGEIRVSNLLLLKVGSVPQQ